MILPAHIPVTRVPPWPRPVIVYPSGALRSDERPLIIEVGPGRGDFLFHLAATRPEARIVGIEIKWSRVDGIIRRLEKRGIKNVALIEDDVRRALPREFIEGSADEIHILFPDPWPKRRHGHHRSLSTPFLMECRRVLKPGGTLLIATDHEPYAVEVKKNAEKVEGLESGYDPVLLENLPDAYPTYFAQKWKAMGKTLYYQKYFKTKA